MDNLFEASYIKLQKSKNHPKIYIPMIKRVMKPNRVYTGNPFKKATDAKEFAQKIVNRVCAIYGVKNG